MQDTGNVSKPSANSFCIVWGKKGFGISIDQETRQFETNWSVCWKIRLLWTNSCTVLCREYTHNSLLDTLGVKHVNAIVDQFKSLREVTQAVRQAGLESSNLIFGESRGVWDGVFGDIQNVDWSC